MRKLTLKAVKIIDWNPVRNENGKLIAISIGKYKNLKFKYINKDAIDYILSIHPLELSSLEKELL